MIGIIFLNDINICPYGYKYIDKLKELNEEYEIMLWDRSFRADKKYRYECKHIFKLDCNINAGMFEKLIDFSKYSRYVKKVIKQNKYDKLIILTSLAGFICFKELMHKYKGKYIFDYRDASYEKISFFRHRLTKIIDNSAFTCISSAGFQKILPKRDYVIAHNFRYDELEKYCANSYEKSSKSVIKVAAVGMSRSFEHSKRMIDIFGGDKRFELGLHGSGVDFEPAAEYAKKFDNVSMTGRYENDEKNKFITDADMLLYTYFCGYVENCALANRYYDALIYKKPLIANIDTFSGELVSFGGIGIGLSFDINNKEYADKVYEYYQNVDAQKFLASANDALGQVLKEDKIYMEKIVEFVKK